MGGNESVEVTAGIWGFLLLFGLAIACWFLFRSMNTHLRRVTFAEREEQLRAQQGAGDPSLTGGDAGGRGATNRHASLEKDVATDQVDDDPIGSARR